MDFILKQSLRTKTVKLKQQAAVLIALSIFDHDLINPTQNTLITRGGFCCGPNFKHVGIMVFVESW